MALATPKAVSVLPTGEVDDWVPTPGFEAQAGRDGQTRLLISVPADRLQGVHLALMKALKPPLSVLYRQAVDRRDPKPQSAPPRDFVSMEKTADDLVGVFERASDLLYHDARCEVWLRGTFGAQVILDSDGLLYCYPDDPTFRDVLGHLELAEGYMETLLERDYVKHWFHADYDVLEDALLAELGCTEVAS